MTEHLRIKHSSPRFSSPRFSGLTLIELVVVMTILVALGGLIVPMLPNFLENAHFAKCATTIPELNKLMIVSKSDDLTYPSGFDSLMDSGGTTLFDALPAGLSGSGEITTLALNAVTAQHLRDQGVTEVFHSVAGFDNVTQNATLEAFPDRVPGTGVAVGDGVTVASIPVGATSLATLGIDQVRYDRIVGDGTLGSANFVVFGVGPSSSMVGPGARMIEAPIHFGNVEGMEPVNNYQRYAVIFAVGPEGADFVCAASIHNDGFDGAESHIQAFYEDQQS